MAKITDTTVPVPVPRTFTMELSEAELALITLIVAKVSGHQVKQWAADVLKDAATWVETTPSAQIVSDQDPDLYNLWYALSEAVNA